MTLLKDALWPDRETRPEQHDQGLLSNTSTKIYQQHVMSDRIMYVYTPRVPTHTNCTHAAVQKEGVLEGGFPPRTSNTKYNFDNLNYYYCLSKCSINILTGLV